MVREQDQSDHVHLDRPITVRDVLEASIALRRHATKNYAVHGAVADLLTVLIEWLAGEPDKPEWR